MQPKILFFYCQGLPERKFFTTRENAVSPGRRMTVPQAFLSTFIIGTRGPTRLRLFAWLILLVLPVGIMFCTPAQKLVVPGNFEPRGISIDTEFARQLVEYYARIPEAELTKLRNTVASFCNIDRAGRFLHYSSRHYYLGGYQPVETRGRFCVWNAEEELIEYGEYAADGRLVGRHATFYHGNVRSLTVAYPEQNLRVARAWDYILENGVNHVTLSWLRFDYLKENRSVRFLFERQTGLLIQREDYRGLDSDRRKIGLRYIGVPSPKGDYEQCVRIQPNGREQVIRDFCPIAVEIPANTNLLPAPEYPN